MLLLLTEQCVQTKHERQLDNLKDISSLLVLLMQRWFTYLVQQNDFRIHKLSNMVKDRLAKELIKPTQLLWNELRRNTCPSIRSWMNTHYFTFVIAMPFNSCVDIMSSIDPIERLRLLSAMEKPTLVNPSGQISSGQMPIEKRYLGYSGKIIGTKKWSSSKSLTQTLLTSSGTVRKWTSQPSSSCSTDTSVESTSKEDQAN